MSAAAQRDELTGHATGTDGAPASALRQIAAERLAAHRSRRAAASAPPAAAVDNRLAQAAVRLQARREASSHATQHAPSHTVRDTVAARYRQSPSYQEFLAAEAERALEKAQAEAEVATRNAVAVAEAQRQLLDEIDQWNAPPEPLFLVAPLPTATAQAATTEGNTPQVAAPSAATEAVALPLSEAERVAPEIWEPRTSTPRRQRAAQPAAVAPADLKIQLFTDLPTQRPAPAASLIAPTTFDPEELEGLDEEIAFRLAPEFQTHIVETTPIQANIIEFPRQLVASRKARPRLAEGPLREDGSLEPQLRIFEVEPEQVSTEPVFAQTAAPEWQSMVLSRAPALDAHSAALHQQAHSAAEQEFAAAHNIAVQAAPQLHAAPVSRRIMALAVDAVCIAAMSVAFLALAARLCGPALAQLPLPELGVIAAVPVALFTVLYNVLFFTLNEATPGMLYARISFCTFAESNPTRRQVRRRLLATVVAVCPLGMGMLWTMLDPDRLGWHDRISGMYPRAY